MALDPCPRYLMARCRLIQTPPKVFVFDRLFCGGAPIIAFPTAQPFGDAAFDIGAICHHGNRAWTLQRLKRVNRGQKLHSIIGGVCFTAFEFAFFDNGIASLGLQQRTPSTRARVA